MYCIVYRMGGTVNFTWHRTLAVESRWAAEATATLMRNQGYAAHVEVYEHSLSIGLPETYDAATPLPEK